MKKKIIRLFCLALVLSIFIIGDVYAQTTNMAYSTETFQLYYTGIAEFTASYTIPTNAGYSLTAGNHVKQAYVNYTRDGVCVTTSGHRDYTYTALSVNDNCHYGVESHAWDTLNPWAPKTMFFYGWIYF